MRGVSGSNCSAVREGTAYGSGRRCEVRVSHGDGCCPLLRHRHSGVTARPDPPTGRDGHVVSTRSWSSGYGPDREFLDQTVLRQRSGLVRSVRQPPAKGGRNSTVLPGATDTEPGSALATGRSPTSTEHTESTDDNC